MKWNDLSFRAMSFHIKIEIQTLHDRCSLLDIDYDSDTLLNCEECKLSLRDTRNKRNDCQHKNAKEHNCENIK